jgi:uncharacterized membrane protein YsdA (DUF1294 family)
VLTAVRWSLAAVAFPGADLSHQGMPTEWRAAAVYAGVHLVASAVTFAAYGLDKLAARRGSSRIRERTLHWLAIAGGWPGALAARELLRHKSSKASFRRVFWLTVVLSVLLFALLWSPMTERLGGM